MREILAGLLMAFAMPVVILMVILGSFFSVLFISAGLFD